LISKTESAVKTSEAAVKPLSNVKKKAWCALRGLKCKEHHAGDIRVNCQEAFEYLFGTLMYAGTVISLAIGAFAIGRRMYRWRVLAGHQYCGSDARTGVLDTDEPDSGTRDTHGADTIWTGRPDKEQLKAQRQQPGQGVECEEKECLQRKRKKRAPEAI
jgi:hypothetical protein